MKKSINTNSRTTLSNEDVLRTKLNVAFKKDSFSFGFGYDSFYENDSADELELLKEFGMDIELGY